MTQSKRGLRIDIISYAIICYKLQFHGPATARPLMMAGRHTPGGTCGPPRLISATLRDEATRQSLIQSGALIERAGLAVATCLETPKDGNCLIHSVELSLSGWIPNPAGLPTPRGFREQMIPMMDTFRGAWERETKRILADEGLMDLDDHQMMSQHLSEEWGRTVALLTDGSSSLEPIHIFALSHIVQRPLICYASSEVRRRACEWNSNELVTPDNTYRSSTRLAMFLAARISAGSTFRPTRIRHVSGTPSSLAGMPATL